MNGPPVRVIAVCAVALLASVLSPLGAEGPAGASARAEPAAVLEGGPGDGALVAGGMRSLGRAQSQDDGGAQSGGISSVADSGGVAPVLGDGFALAGTWLAPR